MFGDYNCDSPLALIESATGFMKEYQNNNQDKDGSTTFEFKNSKGKENLSLNRLLLLG